MGREALDELFFTLMLACLLALLSGCQPEYVAREQWQILNDAQSRFIENTIPEIADPRAEQAAKANDVLSIALDQVKIIHAGEVLIANPIEPMTLAAQHCLLVPAAVDELAYALALCYDGHRLRFYSGEHVASLIKQRWWQQGMNLGPFLTGEHEGIYSLSIHVKS